jgi:hypothetical protein
MSDLASYALTRAPLGIAVAFQLDTNTQHDRPL